MQIFALFLTRLIFLILCKILTLEHRLIILTDRTLDVVFSRFICVSFTIAFEAEAQNSYAQSA